MIGLTPKQRKVLDFLRAYIAQHDRSPSFEEIRLGCWLSSKQQVRDRLNRLEERGYISRESGATRAITLNDPPVVIHGRRFKFIPKIHASDSVHRFRMAA